MNVQVTSDTGMSKINVENQITNDPFEKRFAEQLLTAEFILLEAAVSKNELSVFDVGDLRKRIASHVYRIVGLFAGFLLSLVLGIITGISTLIKLSISSLAASLAGAGVFLALVAICLVAWRRQKKIRL